MMRRPVAAATSLIATIVFTSFSADAITVSTSSMTVSATVNALCTIAAQPLAFGTYGSSQTDASTSVSVTCTNGTSFTVALDAGTGSGGTTTLRKMSGPGGATLNYALYSN